MKIERVLVLRKISSLDFYYNGNHSDEALRKSDEEQKRNLELIEKILKEFKVEYRIITRKEISRESVDSYDLVISAGGDGTVIATAAYNTSVPQLNLRNDTRSNGALCQHDIGSALRNTLLGNYRIEEWTRQDVYLQQSPGSERKFIGRSLNEVCVGEKLEIDKMARYLVEIVNGNERKTENPENSGLIVVTGTGSTAWPAAFEKFPRDSRYFLFKTILPVRGSENGRAESIQLKYKGHEGKFSLDTIKYALPFNSVLEINISENPLRVVQPLP